jgi:G3E family GTPase
MRDLTWREPNSLQNQNHVDELVEEIRSINPAAPIVFAAKAAVPLDQILDVGAFDLERISRQLEASHRADSSEVKGDEGHGSHSHGHSHGLGELRHDEGIVSVSLQIPGVMDGEALQRFIGDLIENHGPSLYRMKGVCSVSLGGGEPPVRLVYQAIHMRFNSDVFGPADLDEHDNRIVFIGRGLDQRALEASFNACIISRGTM